MIKFIAKMLGSGLVVLFVVSALTFTLLGSAEIAALTRALSFGSPSSHQRKA